MALERPTLQSDISVIPVSSVRERAIGKTCAPFVTTATSRQQQSRPKRSSDHEKFSVSVRPTQNAIWLFGNDY
jgi:hypothetical protein